ncbi:MAG: CheR family methyltransferase, partial [Lysobacterales bacterium]
MSRERLLAALSERIGIDSASLGDRVMDHALGEAQRQLGLASLDELATRIALDKAAFTELVEQVIVGETWFFRVPQQFDDLVRFARTTGRSRRPLRVLSLPCASGEEAWSAAIRLREAGLGADEFEILGIDVSPQLVARATLGEYRGSAMRIPAARDPWLEPIEGGVVVAPELRRSVRFRTGNALDPQLFAGEPLFDVAFCRNLLIYLTRDAREQLLAMLRRALKQPALVLAGQAEVLTAITTGFVPMPQGCPLSYLFTEAPAAPRVKLAVGLATSNTAPVARALERPAATHLQVAPPASRQLTGTDTAVLE